MKSVTKKRFGFKEISISMGLFDFDVVCVIGDYENITKYIQWKFENKDFEMIDDYEVRGKCFFCKGYVPVIWIPRKPRTPREYATLSHECIHAIFHLFNWAGMGINIETEELMTHSVGHLVNGILSKIK